jgi:ABC-type transporter Mla subunit MlaD
MWAAIKNALIGVKDAAGIEIPGLPIDLGSIGESAATAVQSVTESATGVIDSAATATDGVANSVADVTETAATATDSAAQSLPDIGIGAIDTTPPK